jgi:hypothetical protein
MENKHQQILSEMNDLVAALKEQIAALEIKISEYQQIVENQLFDEVLPPVVEAPEEVVDEVVEEDVIDGPEAVEPEADDPEVEEVEVEEVEEADETPEVVVEMLDIEEEPEEEQPDMFELEVMDIELAPSDDLPFYDDPVSDDSSAEESTEEDDIPVTVAVIDAMTAKQAWRTDMPGTPVKDIRSAISLNDRILFINYLFGEDPIAFQEMLTKLNAMSSFAEAADHIIASNPDWDLESDTVYRFMMAIRRRLQ